MENPFKFRWVLFASGLIWALMIVAYVMGLSVWKEFAFVHTLIPSVVAIVLFAPLSSGKIVRSRWSFPLAAFWIGFMTPGSYLPLRMITGLGDHCDRAVVCAGGAMTVGLLLYWGVKFLPAITTIGFSDKKELQRTRVIQM